MLFSEVLWVISETVTTAVYNGRGGADVVSGMSAGWAIVNLLFVSFGGINTATSVIIGKTLGKGQLDEARKQKTWMLSAAVVFGLFMTGMGGLVTLLTPLVFGHLSQVAQESAGIWCCWFPCICPCGFIQTCNFQWPGPEATLLWGQWWMAA